MGEKNTTYFIVLVLMLFLLLLAVAVVLVKQMFPGIEEEGEWTVYVTAGFLVFIIASGTMTGRWPR